MQCHELIKPLLNAFTFYQGNDRLCLYICRARPGLPISSNTTKLKALGISILSRPNCIPNHIGCGALSKPRGPDFFMDLLLWNAVNIIKRSIRLYRQNKPLRVGVKTLQRAWRRYIRDKQYKKSSEFAAVQDLRDEKAGSPQLPTSSMVREGAELHPQIQNLYDRFQRIAQNCIVFAARTEPSRKRQ